MLDIKINQDNQLVIPLGEFARKKETHKVSTTSTVMDEDNIYKITISIDKAPKMKVKKCGE